MTCVWIPGTQADAYCSAADGLPNLQLLGGVPNVENQDKVPEAWLSAALARSEQRDVYTGDNDLLDLPLGLADFLVLFARRRERRRARL